MSPSIRLWSVFLVLAALLLSACNMPAGETPSAQNPLSIHTQAAQTVMAQLTMSAPQATQSESQGQPTSTPAQPADTQAPPPDPAQPSPTPTTIVLPSATQRPATQVPTPTQVPCNRAEFVKDVTVEDGEEFQPGTTFTKVWRLKNVGSCTWSTGYSLVFVSGDDLEGDNANLPNSVRPNETVDIEVDLVAPDDDGEYRGLWMLHDGTTRFGLGAGGDKAFWVEIEVDQPDTASGYNFAANYCSADWESESGDLDCPGDEDDEQGFVIRLSNPHLENRSENEPALWTHPEMEDDGWISGEYPKFKIESGDRFLADVGCLDGYEDCDVVFQLNYRGDGSSVHSLGEWREVYDGKITRIDIDLSFLAGETVEFILTVDTNGDAGEDAAFWLAPHIRRK